MINPKSIRKPRPKLLRLWLAAVDPGLIRLRTAGRSALALLSIWFIVRTAMHALLSTDTPLIPLFAVVAGLVLQLFIIDLNPSARKVTLWMAAIAFTAAIIIAGFLADNFWLYSPILLLLCFLSYYFRRYGARAGELAIITTVGYYFGFLLDPTPALYPILLVCVVTSTLVIFIWQFVLIPYEPVKFLSRALEAFIHNVTRTVSTLRESLDSGQGNIQNPKNLQNHLRQVQRNRRVIEGLFSAAVSPSLWSLKRLNQLQEEMFRTERGLELLVEATVTLSDQLSELPADVLQTLKEGLAVLEDQLWDTSADKDQARLYEVGNWLQARIKSSLAEKHAGEWIIPIQRIGIATHQLAQSVAQIHAIEKSRPDLTVETHTAKLPETSHSPSTSILTKKTSFTLHPTTILGLQAVLATGLAMIVAYLLKMDSPNLVFWTAFVVIAGSTGESLRRITMRVAGVIIGTLLGIALVVILPANVILIALLVTFFIFLSFFILTISYLWMVIWLNIAVLLIITTIGGAPEELLVVRSFSTLVGAVIAALVVTYVLPIRVHNRFMIALSDFLRGVDHYIESYIEYLVGTSPVDDLAPAELAIDAAYKKLELTLPGVIFEYNPMTRGQSAMSGQVTSLSVLKGYVVNLKDDVGAEPGSLTDPTLDNLVRSLQTQIHTNVDVLLASLSQGLSDEIKSKATLSRHAIPGITLQEITSTETGTINVARNPVLYYLLRVHDTIYTIATGFGASG